MTRGNNWLTDDQLAEISSGVVGDVEPASPEKCCRFVTDNYARYQGGVVMWKISRDIVLPAADGRLWM
ncbi:hypothetical protein EAW94_24730 [Salmonella enterica]|nr:hypothetical protein [Salmonella enterica]